MSDKSDKQMYSWKNPLNIWTWGCHWNWKYPRTWWDCTKQFFRNFRSAWQRTVRGYCDKDVWDLDEYYCNLFYSSLNRLADITHSYPGREPFSTEEAWDKYLREMANHFKHASVYYQEECYPKYAEAFNNYCDDKGSFDDFMRESKQTDAEQIYHYRVGFNQMAESFRDLWD